MILKQDKIINRYFKYRTIKYLKKNLNCLYEIFITANNKIFSDYTINTRIIYNIRFNYDNIFK